MGSVVARFTAAILLLTSIASAQLRDASPSVRSFIVMDQGRPVASAPSQRGVLRSQPVLIDVSVGAPQPGERLECKLFPGIEMRLFVDRSTIVRSGAAMISGTVEEAPFGSFTFSVRDGAVSGYISIGADRQYAVRSTDQGTWVFEVDLNALPRCGTVDGAQPPAVPADGQIGGVASGNCDDGSVIEVLVCYTPLARDGAGGVAAIQAQIDLAIESANGCYIKSQIAPRLSVVGVHEVAYDENGTYNDHLNRLTNPNDGIMDEVAALRNSSGADLVALFVADGEFCGLAWLAPFDPAYGFSVITWYCASAVLALAHEIGHNEGCCHAVGDGGGCVSGGTYPYSVGWRFFGNSGTQWRTVMAYPPGTLITRFSNPGVFFDGKPTGVPVGQPNQANNALTINQTALSVANFRCSVSTIWVDFGYQGVEIGSQAQPYNTLAEGVTAVLTGGTIQIVAGSSPLPVTISKAMTINAVGGPVTLGQ